MENKPISVHLTEIVEKHLTKLKAFEKIAAVIFALGFVFVYVKQPYTGFILIIGSVMLAISYFLYAFQVVEAEDLESTGILNSLGFINFLYKIMYFSLTVASLTMLGFVFNAKKISPYIVMSGITLFIVFVLSLLTKINNRKVIYNSAFYMRIVIALLLLSYLAIEKFHIVGL